MPSSRTRETESVLRDGLTDAAPRGVEFHRANVRGAIDLLRETSTPRVLIIDVSGEGRPLTALEELSDVVEPDVQVLLIGEYNDVNFYRHSTRILGVKEYLFKPITRDMVARHFGPIILNRSHRPETHQGGRVVTITGVRGGVGASTIAANLAWHLGKRANRHTVLLDADLHRGSCALLLNAKSGAGLRTALETPQRIDELFIERSSQVVAERLHVLSGEENLLEQVKYKGLSEWRTVGKHALRNALILLITATGILLSAAIGGSVIIEQVFALPGIGRMVVQAIMARDYPLVQGTMLILGFSFVMINLTVDILYTLADPRVRHD